VAVAYSARVLGVTATVVVPQSTSALIRDKLEALGAPPPSTSLHLPLISSHLPMTLLA